MCICLNCYRISSCDIYNLVTLKHEENNRIKNIDFYAQSPILVSLNRFTTENSCFLEWDVHECLSYQEKPGHWLISKKRGFCSPYYLYHEIPLYLLYDYIF